MNHFDSYREYLESIANPSLQWLYHHLLDVGHLEQNPRSRFETVEGQANRRNWTKSAVVSLTEDGISVLSTDAFANNGSQLRQSLGQSGAMARIFLLEADSSSGFDATILDRFCLELSVDPFFLQHVLSCWYSTSDKFRNFGTSDSCLWLRSQKAFLDFSEETTSTPRCFIYFAGPANSGSCPFNILVLANGPSALGLTDLDLTTDSSRARQEPWRTARDSSSIIRQYTNILLSVEAQDTNGFIGEPKLLLLPLLRILTLNALRDVASIRKKADEVYMKLTGPEVANWELGRITYEIVTLQASSRIFVRNLNEWVDRVRSQEGSESHYNESSSSSQFIKLFAELQSLIRDHKDMEIDLQQRLEVFQQIREEWSFRDSKASVKYAENAGRTALLAIFFIPLSLGTSVFGMNVRELNGSGPEIWIAITTSLGFLLVVGIALYFLERIFAVMQPTSPLRTPTSENRGSLTPKKAPKLNNPKMQEIQSSQRYQASGALPRMEVD